MENYNLQLNVQHIDFFLTEAASQKETQEDLIYSVMGGGFIKMHNDNKQWVNKPQDFKWYFQ